MSSISDYLKAEIIDPALPRDAFVPPEYEEDFDLDGDVTDFDYGGDYDD